MGENKSICGLDCGSCELKDACAGCRATAESRSAEAVCSPIAASPAVTTAAKAAPTAG